MRRLLVLLLLPLAACGANTVGGSTMGGRTTTSIPTVNQPGRDGAAQTVLISTQRDARGFIHTYSVPAADVWNVLPEVYGTLGVEINTMDTAARRIGNGDFSPLAVSSTARSRCICGAAATRRATRSPTSTGSAHR
jgi:hypothetical protein